MALGVILGNMGVALECGGMKRVVVSASLSLRAKLSRSQLPCRSEN